MPTRDQQRLTARVTPHGSSDQLPASGHSPTSYGGSGPGPTSLVDGVYAASQRRPMEDWGAIGATIGGAVGGAIGDYGGGLYDQYLDPPGDDFYDQYIELVTPPDKPPASKDFTEISGTDKPPVNKDFTEISGTDKPPTSKDLSQLALSPEQLAIKKEEADKLWRNTNPGADPVTGLTPKEKWLAEHPGADPVTGLTPKEKWLAEHPGADPNTGLTPAQTAQAQSLPTPPIFDPTNPITWTTTDTPLTATTPVTAPFPTDPSANQLTFGQTLFPTTGGQPIASNENDPTRPAVGPDNQSPGATVAPATPTIPDHVRAAASYINNPTHYGPLDQATPSPVIEGVQAALGVPTTGQLDAATTTAVTRLQATHGLPQTGILDTPVLAILGYRPNGAGTTERVGSSANALGTTGVVPYSTDLEASLPHHDGLEPREVVYGAGGQVAEGNWPSNLAAPPTVTIDGNEVPFSNQLGLPESYTRITASDATVGDKQDPGDQGRDRGQPVVAPGNQRVIEVDPSNGLIVLENLAATTVQLPNGKTAVFHERLVLLHVDQILVRPGDTVGLGRVVATQGNTATGDIHTHFVGTNQMRVDFLNAQTNLPEMLKRAVPVAPQSVTPTNGETTPIATTTDSGPSSLLTFTPGTTSTLYNPAIVPPGFSANPDPSTLGFATVQVPPWNPGLSSTTPSVTTPASSTPVDVGPNPPGALPADAAASTRPGATDVPGNLVVGPSAGLFDGLGDRSTGDDVRAVQLVLGVPATGIWDPATREAVKTWQTQSGGFWEPTGQLTSAQYAILTAPPAATGGAGIPPEARPLAMDDYPKLQDLTHATPQELAFLRAIRPGEGTNNDHSYSTVVGGGINPDQENHPGLMNPDYYKTTGFNSDATGAYQWLSPTWTESAEIVNERYKGRYQIRTTDQGHLALDPTSQDVAALELIRDLGVSRALAAGDLDAAIDAAAGTWASLRGGGQEHPEHVDAFQRRYQEALKDEENRLMQRNAPRGALPATDVPGNLHAGHPAVGIVHILR